MLVADTFYSTVMQTLADLVRAARARKKLTQEELAERMGVAEFGSHAAMTVTK